MASILVNDKVVNIDSATNVNLLLYQLNTTVSGIAVAINSELISRSSWEKTFLNNGDKVIIITATAGG